MNKRGFTVVELMVTFCLITVISIMLIQLTLTLKDLYISGDMKTTLLTRQGTMTKKINDDLNNKTLSSIESCGTLCINFNYSDESKQLVVDKTKKIVTYDNYSIKLGDNSGNSFGTISSSTYTNGNKQILTIKIPIKNRLLKEDFGINIIYQNNTSNGITIPDLSASFK